MDNGAEFVGLMTLIILAAVVVLLVYLIYKCMSCVLYLARGPREDGDGPTYSVFPVQEAGFGTLDLHGHSVYSALQELKRFLRAKEFDGEIRATVITGKGLHSPHGIPKIKPAVENYLINSGYRYDDFGGSLRVHL